MAALSTEGYAPEWLEYEKVLGARPCLTGTIAEIEEQFIGLGVMIASQSPPPDPTVDTRNDTADGVPVRIYTPQSDAGHNLPVGVYYHGGGYVVGNLDSEDAWCRYIAKNTPCIIISVDYRLGPAFKLPTMLDDSLTAYKWAWQNAEKIGGNQSKFFSVGASAGGGLALTVADQLIKSGKGSYIQGVVALVPVTAHPENIPAEYKSEYTAYTENGSGVPIIDASTMKTFFEAVDCKFNDEKTFVTLSKNLAEFPPTYICTCGKDPLRDDGRVLETMLKKAGVQTKSDAYEGVPHYFWMMPGIKGGEIFLANVVKGAQWALSH